MQHFGLTIELKDDPELIAQYKAYHADPWPEPLQGLGEVGITDMKIFLLGQRMFMYMTATDEFDPARDFPALRRAKPQSEGVGRTDADLSAAGVRGQRGRVVGQYGTRV